MWNPYVAETFHFGIQKKATDVRKKTDVKFSVSFTKKVTEFLKILTDF